MLGLNNEVFLPSTKPYLLGALKFNMANHCLSQTVRVSRLTLGSKMFFVWFFAFTSAESEELMSFRFFAEQLPWQAGFADERTFAYSSIVEKVSDQNID